MKIIDILKGDHKPFTSFELVPPLKGSDINKLYKSIEPLMEFNPPFINVTAHRDEVEYRQSPDGSFCRITVTKRPGTVAIAAAIMKRFDVEVVPHVICGGATRNDIENLLLDLNFLGIQNVMALRGDAVPGEKYFEATPGGYGHSNFLVEQIVNMNNGKYLDDTLKNAVHTDFCIGVAGYPEKHCEAANLDTDIEYLKRKVECGADYIVTQMFFDNAKFFSFVEKCRAAGITVPIIPGIKPISTQKHIDLLPKAFSIDIPQELMKELVKCRDNEAIYRLGIEWATIQCKELLEWGARAVHFYTMGKADNVREIIRKAF
ncbi:MAG: methylenetetrahydrofolate reductase [Bacteroidales bacterium]|nr:methylenetetrahydrofolate reductase [NAD(P)H] [Bacteroidales bacterium]